METLIALIKSLPWQVDLLVALLLALAIFLLVGEFLVRKHLREIIQDFVLCRVSSGKPVSNLMLALHTAWLLRYGQAKQVPVMRIFDFSASWLESFQRTKSRKSLERLLEHYPDRALFPALQVALHHQERAADLRKYLGQSGDAACAGKLHRLCASCAGAAFDAKLAKTTLADYLENFREMTGDMDWAVRDFSIRILLADAEERSQRLLWQALGDSYPHIRAAVIASLQPQPADRQKLYESLFATYLRDPAPMVRQAAKARILADFADLYRLDAATLDDEAALHVLDLLTPGSKEDENLALAFLDGENLEMRQAAARFLQIAGALDRIFLTMDFGDRASLDHSRARLAKALSVNVSGFLNQVTKTANPASLFVGAQFLAKFGDPTLIAPLLERTFALNENPNAAEIRELYQAALDCAQTRGGLESAQILRDELRRRSGDETSRAMVWERIPAAYQSLFVPELLEALQRGQTAPREKFLAAWRGFNTELSLPPLLDLLESTADLPVKQEALLVLGELKQPGLMQTLLEALPQLPPPQIASLCQQLAEMNEKLFLNRAGSLIRGVDAKARAAIFHGLTPAGKKQYLKDLREALSDADPQVRLAAFGALANYDEAKALSANAVKLLHDPIESVRQGVAETLGGLGTEATINELKNAILNPDEVSSVRLAGIRGLGASNLNAAIDILVETAKALLEHDSSLNDAYILAISQKKEKRQVQYLIEKFKDGNPAIRSLIAHGFASMGLSGEESLLELLREDIASLRPMICQALEMSGAVDLFIRQLGHRELAQRKDAASRLILVGTAKAFKGIVQAARDPDPEIRVLVSKSLESLNTPAGASILAELEADPDRRVRRYTAWAMERVRAKSL